MAENYDKILVEITEKIRKVREDRDMSQESVSGMELSVRNYQKIESGKGMPSLKSLLIIADALGIHPKELLDVPGLSSRPIKKKFQTRKRTIKKS
ncbi:helix-turn-helix domain-containing protein [Leptospira sp. GIMC2001]|uniref:helix-turn-helix domain-containing protein n=1 Tax=Leptospira sp. GIMC2001 TaxID=1513297 RepID=UPI002348F7F0|nr:helix-turn-helix transcriptional regulator [Leptospira sp. GIMC2001]WCL50992.1 helix-turn-helix transcriptional regulator [Leptospira sp. GIMC2001]